MKSQESKEFEDVGRVRLEELFKLKLTKRRISPTKVWDYVSPDQAIVGDAKRFAYKGNASSEMSIISEHVWLLEKLAARAKFLLFGGEMATPLNWLRRWRKLLRDDTYFFFLEQGQLTVLFAPGKDFEGK